MELSDNILGFHHVSIKAQNFDQTVEFYLNFGFLIMHSWSLPEFQLERCVMLYNANINYYLEICDKNANFPTQGRRRKDTDEYIENALLHICFTVKDATKAKNKALKIGAKELSKSVETIELKDNNKSVSVTNSLVYSPNGEVIEFLEAVDFS